MPCMPLDGLADVVPNGIESVPSPFGDEPLLLLAIVALALFAGLAYALYRYLLPTPGRDFASVLAGLDSVAVLMHADPDPDAMASALAVSELAAAHDTTPAIYYPGQIRHHENRAFEAVLDVTFEPIDRADEMDADGVVLVDHNTPRELPHAETFEPVAVIDHHPGDGTGTHFTDVRSDTGACATIIAEYFDELGWEPAAPETDSPDDGELPSDISTALVYGVHADTKFLTSGCTEAEFEAVRYLFPGIDTEKHQRIANPPMDAEALDIKARAISERTVDGPYAVSDVGTVSNSDAIPQAADELKRLEGINAVVVMGDKEGTIRLAGRSDDDRVHMGKILGEVVEDIPMASGGGHAKMGGGQVPIEHMEGIGPGDGMTRADLQERLFAAMKGEY